MHLVSEFASPNKRIQRMAYGAIDKEVARSTADAPHVRSNRGDALTERFTARLPDGTDSRAGWVFWMVGAFLGTWFLMTLAKFVVFWVLSIGGLLEAIPDLPYMVIGALFNGVVMAATLVALGAFATRRLLMPRATWFAIALLPALAWLLTVRDLLSGDYMTSLCTVALTASVAIAWALDRRRRLT